MTTCHCLNSQNPHDRGGVDKQIYISMQTNLFVCPQLREEAKIMDNYFFVLEYP